MQPKILTPSDPEAPVVDLSRRRLVTSALSLLGASAALQSPGAFADPGGPTPSQTLGPFYFDDRLIRTNIAEGHPGVPLRVQLRVMSLATSTPVPNARVVIWHATAGGIYSGFGPNGFQSEQTRGRSYCRGTQFTDANGDVTFETVYPGWYVVRTTHIHVRVFVNGTSVLGTQHYFPEAVNNEIFDNIEPYARRGNRPVRNNNDGSFSTQLLFATTAHPGAYNASYTLCIA